MAEHTFAGLTCTDVADLAAGFVLDALSAAEADAVRRHLAECPEPHPELAELNSVVPAMFEAVEPLAPPPDLKQRILAAAAADLESRRQAPAAPPVPVAVPRTAAVPASPRRGWDLGALLRRPVWPGVAAVALAAVVALGVWNVGLQDQLRGLEAYRAEVARVIDAATKPGAQLAVLTDPKGAAGPSGLAAVGADGSVAIVLRNLAPTSGTQVYEAWLIAADGVPVPIGGFQVGASGSGTFTTAHDPLGDGVTVALTLEPGPGATTPTTPIIVAGVARGQSS